jgi:hypothetical protein
VIAAGLEPAIAEAGGFTIRWFNQFTHTTFLFGGSGKIRTCEAEASDLQSDGFNHSPTLPFITHTKKAHKYLTYELSCYKVSHCIG